MKPANLKVTKDDTAKLLASLRRITKEQVLVGIPSSTAGREPEPGEPLEINNATIGYLMENGSPAANIPARPHLRAGVEAAKDKIVKTYEGAAKAALKGDMAAVDKGHHAVGLIASSSVKSKITDGPFEPLSPRTLAARRARGRTGDKPLIDTGQYRQAQTYVVREK